MKKNVFELDSILKRKKRKKINPVNSYKPIHNHAISQRFPSNWVCYVAASTHHSDIFQRDLKTIFPAIGQSIFVRLCFKFQLI
jgi:hypothetical protein